MAVWLVKTEPSTYSFPDLARDGKTRWDGVANNAALIHIRNMRKGDSVFIYHSGDEKAIIGLATVAGAPYVDPKQPGSKMAVVDLAAGKPLPVPVSLKQIKAMKEFAEFALVRISRLSVMPVPDELAEVLLELGGATSGKRANAKRANKH